MEQQVNYKIGIKRFEQHLISEEKSTATRNKYLHDVRCFLNFLDNRKISKKETIAYKEHLKEQYAVTSVNSKLIALNSFLRFIKLSECCVQLLKVQRQIFKNEDKELSRQEYQRLVKAAQHTRLSYVIQTICGTGIRVSELQYITVEALRAGKAVITCKNKTRIVFIPSSLQKLLQQYVKQNGLKSGTIFITKNGRPLNRSNIWREMKALCQRAGIPKSKVYPHSLRSLFARTFYGLEKDIVKLADLLGHSNINTTRIYTMESGNQHIVCLEQVQKMLTT